MLGTLLDRKRIQTGKTTYNSVITVLQWLHLSRWCCQFVTSTSCFRYWKMLIFTKWFEFLFSLYNLQYNQAIGAHSFTNITKPPFICHLDMEYACALHTYIHTYIHTLTSVSVILKNWNSNNSNKNTICTTPVVSVLCQYNTYANDMYIFSKSKVTQWI